MKIIFTLWSIVAAAVAATTADNTIAAVEFDAIGDVVH